MFGSRKRRRQRRTAAPGSLEHIEAWGANFFLANEERLYLQRVHFAQLVHLYPDNEGDGEFTPSVADWDEITARLQALLVGPGEEREDDMYRYGYSMALPYEGVVLEEPFDRTDRTPPPEALVDRNLVFQPDERYYVHHGWVTWSRSGDESRRWWPDPGRRFERYLLQLAEEYGMGGELRRRKVDLT